MVLITPRSTVRPRLGPTFSLSIARCHLSFPLILLIQVTIHPLEPTSDDSFFDCLFGEIVCWRRFPATKETIRGFPPVHLLFPAIFILLYMHALRTPILFHQEANGSGIME